MWEKQLQGFHFLYKDRIRKVLTTMIRLKLEYTEVIQSQEKPCVKIRKNTENTN